MKLRTPLMTGTLVLFLSLALTARTSPVSPVKSATTTPLAKVALIVNKPSTIGQWEVGDIRVFFDDGHAESATKGELCGHPHVSAKGDVGWSVWKDLTDDRYHHTGETLRVRLQDGTIKNFQPNNLFIMEWGFADDDHAIVIKSMAHHGPNSFINTISTPAPNWEDRMTICPTSNYQSGLNLTPTKPPLSSFSFIFPRSPKLYELYSATFLPPPSLQATCALFHSVHDPVPLRGSRRCPQRRFPSPPSS